DVAKEDFRPKLERWLYKVHVPDSISQFEPYVTKYAFYPSYQMPPQGERFGYCKMQLTEHHWLVSDLDPRLGIKAIAETFPMDVLVWQGNIPEAAVQSHELGEGDTGNAARQTNVAEGHPFIFAFLPMWWEEDIKGKGRNIEMGANYRWNLAIGFPEGVDKAEGEKWLREEVLPIFEAAPECTRILMSKVKKDINGCVMDFVLEIWFENQSGWYKVAVDGTKDLAKPAWAQQDQFPFLKPYHNICSVCVSDFTMSNNLKNYHGYLTMR
ncbi:MAG: acetyl-CoA hydrolase, partial [Eubacterium sp.]|nr:acetyl-CoA hydrolase [Eubacterium sp.]